MSTCALSRVLNPWLIVTWVELRVDTVGSDVGGSAVKRGLDGSVSEDDGGSVSGDRALDMSSQV